MVAYLARCQLDPAAPALLDRDAAARVRPGAARPPHPPGRHQRARGLRRRRAAGRGVLRRQAAWVPYIRPGFTLSKQVGEAARANPDLKAVVLAKHGLVVWGDSAEEAYRRTIEVINQAVAFVNERTGDTARFGGRHPAADRARAGAPARAAADHPRRGVEREAQAADGRHLGALAGVRLLRRRGAARDRRRAVPRPPRPHQAAAAVDPVRPGDGRRGRAALADRRARGAVPRGLPRVRRRVPRRLDRARRPRSADRARPAPRARRGGDDDEDLEGLARPLPPRDRGDGGRPRARRVRVARRRGELRDRVLAAGALQARAGAAARRAPGPGRAGHRRRGRHRARDRRGARRRRRVRGRLRPRSARARPTRCRRSATTAWR